MFVVYAMLGYLLAALVVSAIVLRRVRQRLRHKPAETLQAWNDVATEQVRPLHQSSLRGRWLRFYRSPLSGPDFPWVALRDLFEVATDGASYNLAAEWIYANNASMARVVRTAQGPELLLSHGAAMALLVSLVPDPQACGRLVSEFREVMAEAYVLQWAGLSREDFLTLCAAAERRMQDA